MGRQSQDKPRFGVGGKLINHGLWNKLPLEEAPGAQSHWEAPGNGVKYASELPHMKGGDKWSQRYIGGSDRMCYSWGHCDEGNDFRKVLWGLGWVWEEKEEILRVGR